MAGRREVLGQEVMEVSKVPGQEVMVMVWREAVLD
jgi:hypothetical protein